MMIRWLLVGSGVCLLIAGWRTFAVGRKAPPTETERRRAAWGGMPKAYRQTQSAKPWYLRLSRRDRLRRRA